MYNFAYIPHYYLICVFFTKIFSCFLSIFCSHCQHENSFFWHTVWRMFVICEKKYEIHFPAKFHSTFLDALSKVNDHFYCRFLVSIRKRQKMHFSLKLKKKLFFIWNIVSFLWDVITIIRQVTKHEIGDQLSLKE